MDDPDGGEIPEVTAAKLKKTELEKKVKQERGEQSMLKQKIRDCKNKIKGDKKDVTF